MYIWQRRFGVAYLLGLLTRKPTDSMWNKAKQLQNAGPSTVPIITGLKLENYYFFTFTFSRPEVRKLLLFYVFTFSRPEVRKLFRIYVFTFSRPEVRKLLLFYVFTFSRPAVGKLFRIYVFTFFSTSSSKIIPYFDGLVQDCSNPIANSLELLQSCRSRKSKNVNAE